MILHSQNELICSYGVQDQSGPSPPGLWRVYLPVCLSPLFSINSQRSRNSERVNVGESEPLTLLQLLNLTLSLSFRSKNLLSSSSLGPTQ